MARSKRRLHGRALGLTMLALIGALPAVPRAAFADEILVFAAASLKNALDAAGAAYERQGGEKIVVSYGASSTLAKQLDNGAPADVFISADLDWMDYAEQHKLIRPETRRQLLGNRLVLIAPAASGLKVEIGPQLNLAALLKDGRLAIANPDAVPAGKYGKAALQKLGLWDAVAGKLARTEDVRAALVLVSWQEAPLGIVYETDAAADKGVAIAGIFPADSHPPIVYPIAVTAGSVKPGARKFVDFLASPAAKPFFEQQGFTVLP